MPRRMTREEYEDLRAEGECTCGPPCRSMTLGPYHNDDPNCVVHGDDVDLEDTDA